MIKLVDKDNKTIVVTLIHITGVRTLKRIKEIMSSAEFLKKLILNLNRKAKDLIYPE